MRLIDRVKCAFRSVFHSSREDAEFSEELRFHLEHQTRLNLEAGMSPAEARRSAALTVGSLDAIQEASRSARPGAVVRQFARDTAYGFRLLRRSPMFALACTAIVTLGIATTTSVFSVLYGVLLKPLPFADPARLVGVWSSIPALGLPRALVNAADYQEFRQANRVFEDIALLRNIQNFNLIGSGEPERVFGARISPRLLPVLGVMPAIGRNFTEQEDDPNQNSMVVLLSDGLWRRRFGADRSIVGRFINLSGDPYLVVGVMPPQFQYPGPEFQIWSPLVINPAQLTRAEPGFNYLAVARLRPGVSVGDAQRDMDRIAKELAVEHPTTNPGVGVEVLPLLEDALSPVRPVLYAVFGAVSCLLLIGCLNLANLLAGRAAARSREYAMRRALGASRGRLVVQAFAEVAPVLVAGGAVGIGLAEWAIRLLVPLAPAGLPRIESVAIEGPVLAFSTGMMLLTGLVAGLLPAAQAWSSDLGLVSRQPARGATFGRAQTRLRNGLVVAQVALVLPLLVGAALFARSLGALIQVDPGFQTDNVLSISMAIPRSKYKSDEQVAQLCARLAQRVGEVPGVESAAMVNRLPMSGTIQTFAFIFENAPPEHPFVSAESRTITPDYFQTMGIPMIEGRLFTDRDRETRPIPSIPNAYFPTIAIIDEEIARSHWPNRSALGQRFRLGLPGAPWIEVVGVVGHVRHDGLETRSRPQVYFNNFQRAQDRMTLVARGRGDVHALTSQIVGAIRDIDPDQPVYDVRTMDDLLDRSTAQRRLSTMVVTMFAMCALLLASVGLYGVVAYSVTKQQREFGIRLALGAAPGQMARLVLRRGAALAALGVALGLAAAIPAARALGTLLFGVGPMDFFSFATAVGVLVGVVLLASYAPARKAASTDPAITLRAE